MCISQFAQLTKQHGHGFSRCAVTQCCRAFTPAPEHDWSGYSKFVRLGLPRLQRVAVRTDLEHGSPMPAANARGASDVHTTTLPHHHVFSILRSALFLCCPHLSCPHQYSFYLIRSPYVDNSPFCCAILRFSSCALMWTPLPTFILLRLFIPSPLPLP